MPRTNASKQKSHDEAVLAIAEELKRENWDTKANVEGTENPFKIGKFTPDIVATKGSLRRVCDVVTEQDFKGNKQDYVEFRNYCDEYDFHFYVVDKEGKRREVDPKNLGEKRT
jgi:hypothetical protein